MIRFHKPSPTLLLHLAAIVLGAIAASGSDSDAAVARERIAQPMIEARCRPEPGISPAAQGSLLPARAAPLPPRKAKNVTSG